MEEKRNAQKKKKKKHISFLGFLVIAFVLIIAANIVANYGASLETTIVRNGSEESLIEADGYIFRDQTLIYAPADGYLYCEVPENERVSKGEVVMHIYKNEVNLSASNELKKIEQEISKLSEGLRTADVFSSDSTKIEQTIAQRLRSVPKAGVRNDIKKVSEISTEVNSLIEKRRIISGEAQAMDRTQELANLKKQKQDLEAKYNIERTIIHSPITGAFTSRLDGAEEKLSLKALENINLDYLKQLDKLSINPKTRDNVSAGEPCGKIVNNFSWSIAAKVPESSAEGLSVGSALSIRFPDIGTDTISGTITKITPAENGKLVLVINSNKYVDMIYSISKAKVQLIKNSYGGFKIPAKSLRMKDGTMGVYVIRSNKARFVPVELLYSGKEWVIVDEILQSAEHPSVLKLYDELIVNGKDIFEGKVMR
ncbi:MAG: hypothetical protein IJE62_01610 [Clostridia bacterium]|nr:hypothetical protein [Clostridia bacterium]